MADATTRTARQLGSRTGLGSFLVDRRSRPELRPRPSELARRPYRRKAVGLRSAEVAIRAGIDPGYYAKLEQGRAISPSPDVIDAIAGALELNEAEWRHLYDLVGRSRPVPISDWCEACLPDGARVLLDELGASPAYVMDRAYDLLGWNTGMCAVFGDPGQLPPERRNVVWMMFAIPAMQEAIEDWTGHAQRLMAQFRLDWGQERAGDGRFERLRAELEAASSEFRDWWPRHEVQGRRELTKHVRPPGSAERIGFIQSTWSLSTSPGVRFVTYSPDGPQDMAAARACIEGYRAAHPAA
jgi:transcriptional regulator with XRE-family HTH domain